MAILRKQKTPKSLGKRRRKAETRRCIRKGTKLIVGRLRDFWNIPVIFLDIDGVMNSVQQAVAYTRTQEYDPYRDVCCPMAMSNLMRILEEVEDCHIIISSTWRGGTSISCLRRIFVEWGFPKNYARRIVAKTPHIFRKGTYKDVLRGTEIEWFRKKFRVNRYVIIDDNSDMRANQKKRFVQTRGCHGLQWNDAQRAIDILNHPRKTWNEDARRNRKGSTC